MAHATLGPEATVNQLDYLVEDGGSLECRELPWALCKR